MSELTFKDALVDSFDIVQRKAKQAKQTIKALITFYEVSTLVFHIVEPYFIRRNINQGICKERFT